MRTPFRISQRQLETPSPCSRRGDEADCGDFGFRLSAFGIVPLLLALLGILPVAFAASTTAVLDAGGKRVSSASYTMDGSLGSLGGITTAVSPSVVARHGYAGQLCDLQSLALSATLTNINETGTSQLAVKAILDDATTLSLSATNVAWSVVSGPVASINTSGLMTMANVYQNTAATVRAGYQSTYGTLTLTVINTGNDDYGIYANDAIDDAWQVRYFGLNNTNAAWNADPDHDGLNNYQEYIADTNPTNALSCLRIQSIAKAGGMTLSFQSSTNRKYSLSYTAQLPIGSWTNVPLQTNLTGNGGTMTLTDPSPSGQVRAYRVTVRMP
ncbi:MAG: hypothetical protein WCO56_24825 [Verrucomicrobiota bacterium]